MAFVNEKVSEDDREKISSIINVEKIRTQARWIPNFQPPTTWVVDRKRDVYLIFLTGGGREQSDYYVLGIDMQTVVFNVDRKGRGNSSEGIECYWEVHDLLIPLSIDSRQEEIKQLISEGLEEIAFFDPFANGGTVDNPNTMARRNVISFNVEFT